MLVWPQTAYVGQKVVCLKQGEWTSEADDDMRHINTWPRYGDRLTIRDMEINEGVLGFRFMEITNPVLLYGNGSHELNFAGFRFRPADDLKIDISMLTALLNKTPSKEDLLVAEYVERFAECARERRNRK